MMLDWHGNSRDNPDEQMCVCVCVIIVVFSRLD